MRTDEKVEYRRPREKKRIEGKAQQKTKVTCSF